jgi:outer membrane beta-barrel protein
MKSPLKTLLGLATLIFTSTTWAQGAGSDKLDVQALEQKYWTAKDDDFSVVQNRAFSKKGKYFGGLHYGVAINDPYYTGSYLGASGGYFFNESWGVEGTYKSTNFTKSRSFKDILDLGGGPKANEALSQIGVNAIWTPIYAKMSLFDKKIIHFDMGLVLGMSQFTYDSIYDRDGTAGGTTLDGKKSSSVGYSIGIMQQFYFQRFLAIRVDFINSFSTQDTLVFKDNPSTTKAGTKNISDTSLIIGLTIFDWRNK